MNSEADKWKKRYEREKSARNQAELLLEKKSAQLYEANQKLEDAILIETSKLKLEEEKSRAVHQASLDGIILHTQDGLIMDANDKMCELINCEKLLLMKLHIDELLADESKGFMSWAMSDIERVGYARGECLFKKEGGEKVFTEVSVARLEVEGGVIMQAIVRDVTERIESAKRLELATKEAIEANEAKSLFLATMSHEIRTPLNGIIGFTEILLQEPLANEHRHHLELIGKSGEMLLHIITDILDFSRAENHDIELDHADYSMVVCIEETLDVQSKTAASKGVDLFYEIDEGFPALLNGDSGRIRQILINLVSNGIKFTSKGSVVIRAKRLPDSLIEVSVIDTGIGFDMAIADKLFEPFQQEDASTTRMYGGTGLGLAICKRLISAMGGYISASSELGQGACFKITLPYTEATSLEVTSDTEVVSTCAASKATSSSGRVLVVEDHPINAKLAEILIGKLGAEVTICSNGKEAIEELSADHGYDIVMMDMQMPVMDGIEATRRIRKGEAGEGCKNKPIIAMSANAQKEFKSQCLSSGMNHYLSKPIKVERLERVLRRFEVI